MRKGTWKGKVLAWMLALAMVATIVPANAYADTLPENESTTVGPGTQNPEAANPSGDVENSENGEQDTEEGVNTPSEDEEPSGEETQDPEEDTEFEEENQLNTYSAVTFLNDGYPYGKDMSAESVTLVIDVEGSATTYQWQKSDSKDGTFADISGATSKEYMLSSSDSSLTSGSWYRCVVDGQNSEAVETVLPEGDGRTWTKPYSSYYISNGYMAYMANNAIFDAVGLYNKAGTQYMLCTSYGTYWNLFSSSSATPASGDTETANLKSLRVAFNKSDNYDLVFEANLAAGQQAFAFGCDTQLGSNNTSNGYADTAALKATVKNEQLEQIAMVGAATVDSAKDDDPAFVIAPITNASQFWIGGFSSRRTYAYNETNVGGYIKETTQIDGKSVATLFESGDSGMTMSWTNVPSGGTVKFRFKVGSVKDTGAVGGNVNYENETLEGLDPNTTYTVTIPNASGEGTSEEYTVISNEKGEIPLTGTDTSDKEYDFTGKTITVAKSGSEDAPANIEIAGRPDAPNKPSDYEEGTESKPSQPTEAEKIEIIKTTSDSITIAPKEGQQYAYSTDGGQHGQMLMRMRKIVMEIM